MTAAVARHETDVLVAGGGLAAAFAAIKARDAGARVTLVDRGFFGRSGCSALASGVMRAYMPGDDLEAWLANSGGGSTTRAFANPVMLRKVTLISGELVRMMEKWGVCWVRENGELHRAGSADMSGPALAMMDGGGPQMMMAVRAEVLRRGVQVVNRVQINDLLTSDGRLPTRGRVVGAMGVDTRTAALHAFLARATVMATGPMMVPFHSREGAGRGRGMPRDLSGDGQAAMLRAGAVMGKFELGSMGIVPWHMFAAPGLEMLFGLGGDSIFVNASGERFLSESEIRRNMRGRSAVGMSIAREMREGRGPVYLDIRHLKPDQFRLLHITIPIVMRSFEAAGYDPTRERIPYSVIVMATHSVGGGGAAIDNRMATSLPGLYGAGNCTDGAYMSMQQNLPDCAAMGFWAGESAGEEATRASLGAPEEGQVRALAAQLHAPLEPGRQASYGALRRDVDALYATRMGITTDDGHCGAIIEAVRVIAARVNETGAREPREVARIHAVGNFCQTLETALHAIRHRTESRGNVLRSDYPVVDNERWLAYTRLRREADGTLRVWDEPVPGAKEASRTVSPHPFFS